jgi:hypothetical protein
LQYRNEELDKLVAFFVGVAPRATQRAYMDLSSVDLRARAGPSSSLACQIAAGAVACEAIKALLKRGNLRAAPYYHQFDPYLGRYAHGRLIGGNRNPFQRLKRRWLKRFLQRRTAEGSSSR